MFKLVAVSQMEITSEGINRDEVTILGRKRPISVGARYGNALLNIGSMKDGGHEAFAVGAPFEDEGKGAIYIYYSSISDTKEVLGTG